MIVAADAARRRGSHGAAAISSIIEHATAAVCIQEAPARRRLELTAEVHRRRWCSSRSPSHVQAVGQRAADAYVDTEAIRLTAWQAASRLAAGRPPATAEVAIAKYWAAEGGQRVVHAASHLHGGVGVDRVLPRSFFSSSRSSSRWEAPTETLRRLGRTRRRAGSEPPPDRPARGAPGLTSTVQLSHLWSTSGDRGAWSVESNFERDRGSRGGRSPNHAPSQPADARWGVSSSRYDADSSPIAAGSRCVGRPTSYSSWRLFWLSPWCNYQWRQPPKPAENSFGVWPTEPVAHHEAKNTSPPPSPGRRPIRQHGHVLRCRPRYCQCCGL